MGMLSQLCLGSQSLKGLPSLASWEKESLRRKEKEGTKNKQEENKGLLLKQRASWVSTRTFLEVHVHRTYTFHLCHTPAMPPSSSVLYSSCLMATLTGPAVTAGPISTVVALLPLVAVLVKWLLTKCCVLHWQPFNNDNRTLFHCCKPFHAAAQTWIRLVC